MILSKLLSITNIPISILLKYKICLKVPLLLFFRYLFQNLKNQVQYGSLVLKSIGFLISHIK